MRVLFWGEVAGRERKREEKWSKCEIGREGKRGRADMESGGDIIESREREVCACQGEREKERKRDRVKEKKR